MLVSIIRSKQHVLSFLHILNFLSLQLPEVLYCPGTIGRTGLKDFLGHHKSFLFQFMLLLADLLNDQIDWTSGTLMQEAL